MTLLSLPNEILYMIGQDSVLTIPDLNHFCQTNRHLNSQLSPFLIHQGGARNVLLFAAKHGFANPARHALSIGADVETVDPFHEYRILQWASMGGHYEVVQLLLEHGAIVSAKEDRCLTALHWAAACGEQFEHVQHQYTPQELPILSMTRSTDSINSGNRKNSLWSPCDTGHTAVADLLLDHGAAIDAKDIFSRTPLCLAIQFGKGAMVEFLLKRGADLRHGSLTWLPSLVPESIEHMIFNTLMEWDSRGRKSRILADELRSAFIGAAIYGNAHALEWLLNRGVSIETTQAETCENAFTIAVTGGHENVVALLLNKGYNIAATNASGRAAIHQARSPGVMAFLIERGADIHHEDLSKQTPLHCLSRAAVTSELMGCARLLLAKGVDPLAEDCFGRTPLHRAVISSNSTPELVSLLLQSSENLIAQDQDGLTPLHWAAICRRPNMVRLLVAAGADIRLRSGNDRTLLHEIIRLSSVRWKACYSERNVWDWKGQGGSYRDTKSWDWKPEERGRTTWERMVKVLLDLGADVFAVDDTGRTPAKAASEDGWEMFSEILTTLSSPKIS